MHHNENMLYHLEVFSDDQVKQCSRTLKLHASHLTYALHAIIRYLMMSKSVIVVMQVVKLHASPHSSRKHRSKQAGMLGSHINLGGESQVCGSRTGRGKVMLNCKRIHLSLERACRKMIFETIVIV